MIDFEKYCVEKELIINIAESINERKYEARDKALFAEMFNEYEDSLRQCDCCGNLMCEGHYVDEDYEYYCSDECLNKAFTKEEQEQLYEQNLLWLTEWV